ncbi:MAG: class I SAM-dependent methyltransferase [Burkholderiales bacterium]
MSKFTEESIRPAQLMVKQRIAALTDIGRMLSRCSEFVDVSCPACSSDRSEPKFEKHGFSYVQCPECQTFYVNPRPTAEVLAWFYQGSPNYAYWNDVVFPASEAARLKSIFIPRVDRLLGICREYGVKTDSLIEIGSGFGTFCSEVKRREIFSRVVAVEPTPDLANTCRGRGLEVIELPVEQIRLNDDERFDVVASFEVIEHLFSPADMISHMVRLIRPGGILLLTCPNGHGFDIETLGTASDSVDSEHLNYFNPGSLATLLQRCGLTVLESFTPGQLDAELVRNKVLANKFDISGQPFLKRVLIDEWDQHGNAFQDFLIAQGLSSNMWIVARKTIDTR